MNKLIISLVSLIFTFGKSVQAQDPCYKDFVRPLALRQATEADLELTKTTYNKLLNAYASFAISGHSLAAEYLLRFMVSTGGTVNPTAKFCDILAVRNSLKSDHRNKFVAGLQRRLNDGTIVPGRDSSIDLPWCAAGRTPKLGDFAFAIGGHAVSSKATFKIGAPFKRGRKTFVTFSWESWTAFVEDVYTFDTGDMVSYGFSDSELTTYEDIGKAKRFDVKSESMNVLTMGFFRPSSITLSYVPK